MKENMEEVRHSEGRTFRKFGVITIVAVYLLILIGGIVRSTGSGMGCPDWPKCFGSWVPPTQVSQLPADYQEVYARKRKAKNDRLATTLERLNFTSMARLIAGDPSVYKEAEFNPVKTWIEYVNRLVGVLIGLFIFITALLSFRYRKTDPLITVLSVAAFLLVGFQGWLGSIVVSTNLLPGTITIHMLLAIVIVCLLIYVAARSWDGLMPFRVPAKKPQVNLLLTLALLFSVAQVVLGTQVREGVDSVSSVMGGAGRETWIDKLGIGFYIHRSFSILVLLVNLRLIWLLGKGGKAKGILGFLLTSLIVVVVTSIASGAALAYFAIPAVLQPVHLLLASLLSGIQFALLLFINQKKVLSSSTAESTSKQYLYQ